jgi:CRP-like cAMP-binding protein
MRTSVAGHAHRRSFNTGEPIFHFGAPGQSMMVIVNGTVRVSLPGPRGKGVILVDLEVANRRDSRGARAVLFHMAEEWLHLADQERSTGPQRVDRSLRLATASPVEAGLRELIAEAEQRLATLQERRQGEPRAPSGNRQGDAS